MLAIAVLQAIAAGESGFKGEWRMTLTFICFSVSSFALAGAK